MENMVKGIETKEDIDKVLSKIKDLLEHGLALNKKITLLIDKPIQDVFDGYKPTTITISV
jgi:hypothetical protein